MKWEISVNNMVCLLLLLLGKRVKNMIKAIKNIKIYRNNFVKPNDFYGKKKKHVKQRSSKDKCFNCGKPGHFSKDCKEKPGKLKNKFNMLNIDDNAQEELFRILESNNSSDSLEDDFSSSSDSCYHSADDSSDSPNIKIGCRDSCCNVINALTKSEEDEKLIIQLINQIQNPELQKEYLDRFKKNLIRDETGKKPKSTISFEETLERFNKKKSKELTVNDLQHEINIAKQEISELKHDFKDIKVIKIILNKDLSIKMEMNPVNKLFFLVKVLLMMSLFLNLLLLIK